MLRGGTSLESSSVLKGLGSWKGTCILDNSTAEVPRTYKRHNLKANSHPIHEVVYLPIGPLLSWDWIQIMIAPSGCSCKSIDIFPGRKFGPSKVF